MSDNETRGWLIDLVVGAVAGGLGGAVVAINVVIYSGIEDGYQANLAERFEQNLAVGIVAVAILLAGPILGERSPTSPEADLGRPRRSPTELASQTHSHVQGGP